MPDQTLFSNIFSSAAADLTSYFNNTKNDQTKLALAQVDATAQTTANYNLNGTIQYAVIIGAVLLVVIALIKAFK